MEKGEAYFIEHCDFLDCDLGTFQYICPDCGKYVEDYDIWWKQDEIWKGSVVVFKCPECGKELLVMWDVNEIEFKVKVFNDGGQEQFKLII